MCGKTFDEWLTASDREWVDCHSFIQWIFPLMYASQNAPGVLLDEQSLNELKRPEMLHRMKLAFKRLYDFLGFDPMTKKLRMYYYGRVDISNKRISRALASMQNVGLVEESYILLESLIISYPNHVSMRHWKDACLGAARSYASNASCLDLLRSRNTIVIDDERADGHGGYAHQHVDGHGGYAHQYVDAHGGSAHQHVDAHGGSAQTHGGYVHLREEAGSGSGRHAKKHSHFIDLSED